MERGALLLPGNAPCQLMNVLPQFLTSLSVPDHFHIPAWLMHSPHLANAVALSINICFPTAEYKQQMAGAGMCKCCRRWHSQVGNHQTFQGHTQVFHFAADLICCLRQSTSLRSASSSTHRENKYQNKYQRIQLCPSALENKGVRSGKKHSCI